MRRDFIKFLMILGISLNVAIAYGQTNVSQTNNPTIPIELNVFLYPNPSTDIVNFHFDHQFHSNIRIEVSDYTGQLKWTIFDEMVQSNPSGVQVNIISLPPGTYTYKLITNEGIAQGKLVRI